MVRFLRGQGLSNRLSAWSTNESKNAALSTIKDELGRRFVGRAHRSGSFGRRLRRQRHPNRHERQRTEIQRDTQRERCLNPPLTRPASLSIVPPRSAIQGQE